MITNSGNNVPQTVYGDQMSAIQQLTLLPNVNLAPGGNATPDTTTTAALIGPVPAPVWAFAGIVVVLVLLHFATEKSELKPQHMRIGVHNWWVSGLMAMSFFIFAKVVMNKITAQNIVTTSLRSLVNAA